VSVKPRDREVASVIESKLRRFDEEVRPLLGLTNAERMKSFVAQIVESIHRVRYRAVLLHRELSPRRSDPNDEIFDPLMAAVIHQRAGSIEEALWCVFLFIHFGKNSRGGWRYAREVYGRLGAGPRWDWASVSAAPQEFRNWLRQHAAGLRRPGVPGGFGNHRKYESLDADSDRGTGAAVESYVQWISPPRTHQGLFATAYQANNRDARRTFDALYRSMQSVKRFGRIARFEYLATVGALGLAPIEPGSAYITQSTGPKEGAKLLFGGATNAQIPNKVLDAATVELDEVLVVGMQVLEDALCNWKKSPDQFRAFRG
jgi:hypothetical protein